jgi:hypothetical protein
MNGVGLMVSFCFLSLVQNSEKDNGKQNVSLQLLKISYKEHVHAVIYCSSYIFVLYAFSYRSQKRDKEGKLRVHPFNDLADGNPSITKRVHVDR